MKSAIPLCRRPSPRAREFERIYSWTGKEVESLISEENLFRQKYGPIREPDQWEEIAVMVALSLGFDGIPRPGTQCSSKMKQLRRRYESLCQQGVQPEAMPPPFQLMYRLEQEDMQLSSRLLESKTPSSNAEVDEGASGESQQNASSGEEIGEEEEEKEEEVAEQEFGQQEPADVFGMSSNGKKRMGSVTSPAKTQDVRSGDENRQPTFVDSGAGTGETAATAVDVEQDEIGEGEAEWKAAAALELVEAVQKIDEGFLSMERRRMELMRELEKGWMEMEAKKTAMMYKFEKDWTEMEAKRAEMMHESRRSLLDLVGQAFRPAAKRARRSQHAPGKRE